jgi:hypothetical protein
MSISNGAIVSALAAVKAAGGVSASTAANIALLVAMNPNASPVSRQLDSTITSQHFEVLLLLLVGRFSCTIDGMLPPLHQHQMN